MLWKSTLIMTAIAHVLQCANAQLSLIVGVPAGNNLSLGLRFKNLNLSKLWR